MANHRKGEPPFTHWTHFENGESTPRRFHRIIEHFDDDPSVEILSDRVPYAVITHSGDGYKDQHDAHFYYSSDSAPFTPNFRPQRWRSNWRRYYSADPTWPTRRDVVHMAIGLIAIGILRFIAVGSVLGGY